MKQRRGEEDKQAVRVVRIRVQIEPDTDPAMVLKLDGSSGHVTHGRIESGQFIPPPQEIPRKSQKTARVINLKFE